MVAKMARFHAKSHVCWIAGVVISAMVSGCSDSGSSQTGSEDSGVGVAAVVQENLAASEEFIDAFYSWDATALAAMMTVEDSAAAEVAAVLYYQAWAQAGNYQIQTRRPCTRDKDQYQCAITVTDDIGAALGYVATDTFTLRVTSGRVVGVSFDSDDPPILDEVFTWMGNARPEVFSGPCKDLFAGGLTPAACVRAVVQSAKDYRQLQE